MSLIQFTFAVFILLAACSENTTAQISNDNFRPSIGHTDSLARKKKELLLDSLIFAAWNNKVSVVKDLVSRGVDANGKIFRSRHYWESPLSAATRRNHTEVVKILVAHGADPNLDLGENSTAFQISAGGCSGDLAPCSDTIFNLLLANGGKVNTYNKYLGGTPLRTAIEAGDIKKATLLIEAGAVLNSDSVNGFELPLMIAVMQSQYDMVALLLKHGASANATYSQFVEDCMLLCMDSITIAHQLVGMYNYENVNKQKIEATLDLALRYNLNLNMENGGGFTPVGFAAALEKDGELVDKLIKRGAVLENKSSSALHCAAAFSNVEMIEHLFKYKVNVNRQDYHGNTPLYLSLICMNQGTTEERFAKTVDLLLSHGADPTIKNKSGESFIKHVGVESRNEVKKILAKYGY